MRQFLGSLLFIFPLLFFGQENIGNSERYPIFPACDSVSAKMQENCFNKTLIKKLKENFKLPALVAEENYTGQLTVLFEVTPEGNFRNIYVDAYYDELKTEIERVIKELPQVKPATYNGRPIFMQFKMPVRIPIEENTAETLPINTKKYSTFGTENTKEINQNKKRDNKVNTEYDSISKNTTGKNWQSPSYSSNINIPFSHEVYSRFDDDLNQIGTNAHTAVKPYLYKKVNTYYNFEEEKKNLAYDTDTWFGRKFFNEHLVRLQGEDFWFTADVAADLQIGKDFDADFNYTYNNTRAAVIQGGLGDSFNFYAAVYESQGRFAQYFNQYAESIRPDGGNPAIIPGRGIAKDFRGEDYDYPLAEGYISYSPSKFFNLQFGHGKNFIGDGYRSMLMSDAASPYPYFKVTTNFWKLQYTNTWMSMRDVRPAVTDSGSFRTKYMATHYLSYNVTKRLNIGLFESVVWENDNDRGFDLNYLNPIIFYRAIEFSTGSRGGNALIGLSGKYKWSNHFNMYAQLMIDEFSSGDIFGGKQSFKNKLAYQIGLKYFNAFDVNNLQLQLEYNQARPYTYSHNTITLNYGHNNQSIAHLWGANFREVIAIARYKKNRWYGSAKLIVGKRGLELEKDLDPYYGGDIYGSEYDIETKDGNEILQGNKTDFFYGEVELGYIVNPATNLKVYTNIIHRKLDPSIPDTPRKLQENTTWLNFGFRTDLFNWYYDF